MKLRKKVHILEPSVWIGKNGLSEQQIREINEQLKKKKVIKIKFLKSALKKADKKTLAAELLEKTGARLVRKTGFVVVLRRKSLT